jgi:hypothetical protein
MENYTWRMELIAEVAPWASLMGIKLEVDHLWNDQIVMTSLTAGFHREVRAINAETLRREVVKFFHYCEEK